MTVRDLVYIPNEILKTKAKEVEKIDSEISTLIDDMIETMYDARGIGLAANQIGQLHRIIVMDIEERQGCCSDVSCGDNNPIVMINPKIIESSTNLQTTEEGCLSIPGATDNITRPDWVKVEYRDQDFELKTMDCEGLLGVCVQHEIDHLDGVLYIDYLSKLKCSMIERKVKKYLK